MYWGGRPLWNNSANLHQHKRDIIQTFMVVDSPSDNIQTHKALGQNSPRGRVSGQKSLENPEKLSPGGRGGTGVGDHLATCSPSSVSIDRTSPKLVWQIALVIIYKPTRFQGETHQRAGSVGKKVLKIPKKS